MILIFFLVLAITIIFGFVGIRHKHGSITNSDTEEKIANGLATAAIIISGFGLVFASLIGGLIAGNFLVQAGAFPT